MIAIAATRGVRGSRRRAASSLQRVGAEIAVVIPSRRGPRLAFALEGLAVQSLPRERFEVIVVRDPRSRGGNGVPAVTDLRLRFLTAPRECGPTLKRNLGWRATEAPLVAFTDDDCRPSPEWLERLLAGAPSGTDRFLLQGRTEPDPDERHLIGALARTQLIDGPSRWFEGCNVAYPRTLLTRLDGFDEEFEFGSEDTDLGLRALAAGASHIYRDDALVWHAVTSRPLPIALREAARFPTEPLVLRRHPRQRAAIYGHYFRDRSHATLLLAAAGTLLARRWPVLAAAAALPYIELNVDFARRSPRKLARQLLGLPSRALVDAVEVAATARAAWRHRVLVI